LFRNKAVEGLRFYRIRTSFTAPQIGPQRFGQARFPRGRAGGAPGARRDGRFRICALWRLGHEIALRQALRPSSGILLSSAVRIR
jgi:hypothetical protein